MPSEKVQRLIEEFKSKAAKKAVEHKEEKEHEEESEVEQVNEFYTLEQLKEAFEQAGYDTRKYRVEYLAEKLGFEAKEFLNESTGKKVVLYEAKGKVSDRIKSAAAKAGLSVAAFLTLIGGSAMGLRAGSEFADDYLLNKAKEEYAQVIGIDPSLVGARVTNSWKNRPEAKDKQKGTIFSDRSGGLLGLTSQGNRADFYYLKPVLDKDGNERFWSDGTPMQFSYGKEGEDYYEGDAGELETAIEKRAEEVADKVYNDNKTIRDIGTYGGQLVGGLGGVGAIGTSAVLSQKNKDGKNKNTSTPKQDEEIEGGSSPMPSQAKEIELSDGSKITFDESYTLEQLKEAFEEAGLDTRKYRVEYLAEQLGFEKI